MSGRLVVMIDGATLDEEPGRALWTEFSAHMEAHPGDMAGFAKAKGWQHVAPEYRQGKAVLVVTTGAPRNKPEKPGKNAARPPKAGPRGPEKA